MIVDFFGSNHLYRLMAILGCANCVIGRVGYVCRYSDVGNIPSRDHRWQ